MESKKAKSVGISGGFAPTDLYCFRAVLYQPYPPIFYGSLNVIQPDVRVLKSAFRERVGVCPPAKSCRKGTLDSRANRTAYRPFPFWPVLTLLFEADMLFGNENRHLNNIAVLRRGEGFDYCPLFDFGAGLLSNTRDYPLDLSPAPTCGCCARFRWTLPSEAARAVYGPQLEWDFAADDIADALAGPLAFYAQRDRTDIANG